MSGFGEYREATCWGCGGAGPSYCEACATRRVREAVEDARAESDRLAAEVARLEPIARKFLERADAWERVGTQLEAGRALAAAVRRWERGDGASWLPDALVAWDRVMMATGDAK